MARKTLPADGQTNYGALIRDAINSAQDAADAATTVVPPVTKTGNFTFDITLAGKVTEAESTGAIVATVPPVSSVPFAGGTVLEVRQTGSGLVSVSPGAGVTLRTPTGQGLKVASQWDSIYLSKRAGAAGSSLPSTNLALRYNADDIAGTSSGPVAAWPESSGNNHPDAAQTDTTKQPTLVTNSLNGHKGVSFNSTSSSLALSGSALNVARNIGALTVFVVYSYPSALQGARTLFGLSTGETTPRARVLLQQREQANGLAAAGGRRNDTDASQFISGPGDAAGVTNVLTASYNWPNTTIGLYRNGTQLSQNTAWLSAGNTVNTASTAGYIGCTVSGTAEFFGGRIYEIIAYADDSTALRTSVHSYIQNTYGIAVSDFSGNADEWIVSNGIS